MAIIPQQTLFVWSEIEELRDLERLKLVLEYMPDGELMEILEEERLKWTRRLSDKSIVEFSISRCCIPAHINRKPEERAFTERSVKVYVWFVWNWKEGSTT